MAKKPRNLIEMTDSEVEKLLARMDDAFVLFGQDLKTAEAHRTFSVEQLKDWHKRVRAFLTSIRTIRREVSQRRDYGKSGSVENSPLIQQASRRNKELSILNEIGLVLSSTLDADALFEKIYTGMQRLLDASNLYIAFFDDSSNVLRFELDIRDGVPQPKRTRAGGNHLSEYVIENRQPLLIRENVEQEARRLGVEPLMPMGCFCAVPLVLYDRAVGVMALLSRDERAFDDGHLELMRVLASEATIALENARLFRGEQIKSRHLALLNNISRNTIATLNPDEMLARIATELESGLTYDHISIGLLDYVTKEVVIQAQAGKRKDAEGRRIRFGEGLVGRVARTGEIAVVRDLTADTSMGAPLLERSASAVVLPIVYGDQLHGVLCVETAEPCDFTVGELQLLETLADLVSGALHGAISFQKAQEQAITDGLTGVKTHRYFMETLSAEWKRATRADQQFAVIFIDLDNFKQVNDTFGHAEGDEVLRRTGQVIGASVPRSSIVGRYGGDEFIALIPTCVPELAVQIAERVRKEIAADAFLASRRISASLGVASFPLHGATPEELIKSADSSMYDSKQSGRNRVSGIGLAVRS